MNSKRENMDSERNITVNQLLWRQEMLQAVNESNAETLTAVRNISTSVDNRLHAFELLMAKQPDEERIKELIGIARVDHEQTFHMKRKDTPVPFKNPIKRDSSFSFLNKIPFTQIAKIATFVGFMIASVVLGMQIGG